MDTRDVVCGMRVDPEHAPARSDVSGQAFYFCCRSCKEKFDRDPDAFIARPHPPAETHSAAPVQIIGLSGMKGPRVSKETTAPMPARSADRTAGVDDREYTCPMDPEVRQRGPGSCPKCGMALEPIVAALEDANPELEDMTRRFRVSLLLTAPILLTMLADVIPAWHHLIPGPVMRWGALALATPVVLWGGWPFFVRGWTSVVTGHLNMFTLISLGVGAAYGYSLAATLVPSIFPSALRQIDGTVPVYFEPAAVIIVLVLLGQVLELRARRRTSAAIRNLLSLAPATARLVQSGGADQEVPIESIRVGHLIRVRPGERIAVDGVVRDGTSTVDESMVTGEAMPVRVAPDSAVTGGTLNGTGSFVFEARRVGSDTLLAQIVRMVSDAQRSRAPVQRLADRVAGWFVPAVIAVAIATAVVWGLWGPEPRLAHALVNAVAVLIIACPCALGLATPMSIMVGTGRAAEVGVLFRNAEALELLEQVSTLLIDKTGTLTEGRPSVVTIVAEPPLTDDSLLRYAASLEHVSEHPLAAAIVAAAGGRRLPLTSVSSFESATGSGVRGVVDGKVVVVGNGDQMRRAQIDVGARLSDADDLRAQGQTIVFVGVDGRFAGLIGIADPVKPTAAAAIAALHRERLRIVMVTGDSRMTADAVARRLGIDAVIAEVLPAGKADVVKRLQAQGVRVAMAGDGINDAPALAQADVGIAMGTGTDIALESAPVTLTRGDLRGIVRARRLSRATLGNIRQNLFFAFVYNIVGVPIAAGVLYPLFGLLLSPMIASAAMTFSSVSVIVNALRLRRVDI